MSNPKKFELKELPEGKFEYIAPSGKKYILTKQKVIDEVLKGTQFYINGVLVKAKISDKTKPSAITSESQQSSDSNNLSQSSESSTEQQDQIQDPVQAPEQPQPAVSPTPSQTKVFNFTTSDDANFVINGTTVNKDVILKNLRKGLSISINDIPIKLNENGTDFEYVNNEQPKLMTAPVLPPKTPTNSQQELTAYPLIKLTENEFEYNNQVRTKDQLIEAIKKGFHFSVDGKLIKLNEAGNDLIYSDDTNFKRIEQKPSAIINLEFINSDKFYNPSQNIYYSRGDVVKQWKNEYRIIIDDKEYILESTGVNFIERQDVKKQEQEKLAQQQAELEEDLPTYFGNNKTLLTAKGLSKKIVTDPEAVEKLKKLQKRLFFLTSESNMINVDTDPQTKPLDLARFIKDYQKIYQKTNIWQTLCESGKYIFDFSQKSKESDELWKQINLFYSKTQDTFKELGGDFTFIGYPSICDVIYDVETVPKQAININAPLLLIKVSFVFDQKNKNVAFKIDKENNQVRFLPNKELLLYLTTKLGKELDLDKYQVFFDESFKSYDKLIQFLTSYFKDLDIKINSVKLYEYIEKFIISDYKAPAILTEEQKQKRLSVAKTISTSDINVTSSCFLGIFKTQNSEIFNDYNRLIHDPTAQSFIKEVDTLVPNQLQYYQLKGKDFQESEIRQIVPLDYSQKVACKLALMDSINIVGPAGTGKSQTISNILANFIDRHESALFVAEKKTATDVVFNRLKSLRYYCLPLFDKENWNETLAKALKQTLRRVGDIYGKWDTLELTSVVEKPEEATMALDKQFTTINNFRRTMSSTEGYEFPKLSIKFASPEFQEKIRDMEKYVLPIFTSCNDSESFWSTVNASKLQKILYDGCLAILDSIEDDEIKNSEDLQNRLLKACKYYDSPTLLDNELIQIIQALEYDDEPIVQQALLLDKQAIEAVQKGNKLYKKFEDLLMANKAANLETLSLIKRHDGFITVAELRAMGKKIDAEQKAAQILLEAQAPKSKRKSKKRKEKGYYGSSMPNPADFQANEDEINLNEYKSKNLVNIFANKYDEHSFNFDEIKHYYDLKIKWVQRNQKRIIHSPSEWYDSANTNLNNKIQNDIGLSELHFLTHVRETISKSPKLRAQYNKLYGIVDDCTKLDDVNKILQTYGNIICLIFPIVIGSPNLVCKYVNPINKLFKHVVIDEASMLSLEKAIPILFRGEKYCIVGDSKQLQPLTYLEQLKKLDIYKIFFKQKRISREEYTKQEDIVNDYKGVLDYISSKIQKTTLQYHYRAVKTELVKFSSTVFYDNEMIISDNYSNPEEYKISGLHVKQINGDYSNGVNVKECQAIYNELLRIAKYNKRFMDVSQKLSVGIIVFTPAQKIYLENLINSKHDADVLNMYMMFDAKTGEDNSLFIKDVESVQGDERDIILMSLGSSSKQKAEIPSSLGLINSKLGPNFLNVMTTRARKAIYIYKSFKAEDLPNTGNQSVIYYRDFIKYIDLLSQKQTDKIKSEIDNLFKEYEMRSATIDYSSFAPANNKAYLNTSLFNRFKAHIDEKKYRVVPQVEAIQGFFFGLVAYDRKTNIPEFALIFDDFLKNLYKTSKQSEFYDLLFLAQRGWKFHKINAYEWSQELIESNKHEDPIEYINGFLRKQLTFGDTCYFVVGDDSIWETPKTLTKKSRRKSRRNRSNVTRKNKKRSKSKKR